MIHEDFRVTQTTGLSAVLMQCYFLTLYVLAPLYGTAGLLTGVTWLSRSFPTQYLTETMVWTKIWSYMLRLNTFESPESSITALFIFEVGDW